VRGGLAMINPMTLAGLAEMLDKPFYDLNGTRSFAEKQLDQHIDSQLQAVA
jgi:hypothetical protein